MATVIDELEIKVNSNGLDALLGTMDKLAKQFEKVGAMSKGFSNATAGVTRSASSVEKATAGATKQTNKFLASIIRIAKYRLIRSALRMITKAIKEGVENFYNFSKATGESLSGTAEGVKSVADAMDSIKMSGATLKNQLGSAFGTLLANIAPVINAIIGLITRLANALSMLFSLLGGRGGWYKAAEGADALGDAIGGAGGAAKEALRYLAPFDELNVLPKDSGGGGGGGGGNIGASSDMFEWQEFSDNPLGDIGENVISILSDVVTSITDTFNNASEWLANVDWNNVGQNVYGFLSDAFTRVDWTGLASSIFRFLGTALGATVNTIAGFVEAAAKDTAEYFKTYTNKYLSEDNTWYENGALAAGGFLEGVYDALVNPVVEVGESFLEGLFAGLGLDYQGGKAEVNAVITASADMQFEQQDALTRGVWDWIAMGHQPLESTVTVTPEVNAADADRSFLDRIFGIEEQAGIDVPVTIKRSEHTEQDLDDILFGNGTYGKIEREVNLNVDTVFRGGSDTFIDFIQSDTGEITATIGLQKSPEWDGGTVSDWIKNVQQWGANLFKDIGLERGKDSNGRLWTDLTSWISGNFWGGDLNKAVGIAQPNGNRWGTVYKWIRNNYWGGDLNKAIYIAQPNSGPWGTVAKWIQTAKNWGGSLFKEIGLTKQKSGDGAWTTVAEWIKKLKNWGTTVLNAVIGLMKGDEWKGKTITDWARGRDNFGEGSAYVTVHVTREVEEVHVRGGRITKATGGVFENGAWKDITRYASGGMPTGSQLFWAREAGPELVGTLGGHTAVMNNDQIVASVSSGIVRAMSGIRFKISGAATSGGMLDTEALYSVISRAIADNEPDTEISLDGDVVYRKMLNRNRLETYRTGNNPMMTMA